MFLTYPSRFFSPFSSSPAFSIFYIFYSSGEKVFFSRQIIYLQKLAFVSIQWRRLYLSILISTILWNSRDTKIWNKQLLFVNKKSSSLYLYNLLIYICLSLYHNSWTPWPICLKFWLVNSVELGECPQWAGFTLTGKTTGKAEFSN